MSIIDQLPAIRRGEAGNYTEQFSQPTTGHRDDEPGLRGHSVGDIWPWRVVGKGDGSWEIHRNGCAQILYGLSCEEAHRVAKQLAEGTLTWATS